MASLSSGAPVSVTGWDARTNVVFAVARLKEKAPSSISAADLVAYVMPKTMQDDAEQSRRFSRFLNANPKVSYNPKDATYTYRPIHNIFTANDLLEYLQNQKIAQGIKVSELKDGWPDVATTIDELDAQNKILVTRNKKDNHAMMVWANDPTLNAPLDQEYKDMWHKIALPHDQEDVVRELILEGHRPAGSVAVKKPVVKVEKKKKKVTGRSRMTNVHMQGMFRDYSGQRPQAGK